MSAEFKDYYETLGIARDASAADIKKAFRKLARKHHPDIAKDKKSAEEKFKEINEANEVLRDPEKRKKYDELGADWQHGPPPYHRGGAAATGQEFNFEGTGFSDFFEQYFSGGSRFGFPESGGRPSTARERRGNDIEGDILVTLEEVMRGDVRPISLQITNPRNGQVEERSFQVRIPPGVTEGKRIRIPSQGQPGSGGATAGDLYLHVRHAAHPDFHADGADLYCDLSLAPWEAVLGTEVSVPTLDGPIKLRIPAGSENGQLMRVRSRGFPRGNAGERGDFYATLTVYLPKKSTPEEIALWQQLRKISPFNPRPTPP